MTRPRLYRFSSPERAGLLALLADSPEPLAGSAGHTTGGCRLAVLASSAEELRSRLGLARERLASHPGPRWRHRQGIFFADLDREPGGEPVAFLFPGQGSQFAGMLAHAREHLPGVQEWFDQLDEAWVRHGRVPLTPIFWGEAKVDVEGRADLGGAATTVASLALCEVLARWRVPCAAMAGSSSGENAALIAAGAYRFQDRGELFDLLAWMNARGEDAAAVHMIPRASFLAVSLEERSGLEKVLQDYPGRLWVALDNCPRQVVLAGLPEAAAAAEARLSRAGAFSFRLPFDWAFHTPLYEPVSRALRSEVYSRLRVAPPRPPVYACATAAPYPDNPEAVRELAAGQWSAGVRLRETLLRLYQDGARHFVEVGPGGRLAGFCRDTLRGCRHTTWTTAADGRSDLAQLLEVAGFLFCEGADIDPEGDASRPRVDLDGAQDDAIEPGGLPLAGSLMQGHFQLMNEFLHSQQRVLSAALDSGYALAMSGPAVTPGVATKTTLLGEVGPEATGPAVPPGEVLAEVTGRGVQPGEVFGKDAPERVFAAHATTTASGARHGALLQGAVVLERALDTLRLRLPVSPDSHPFLADHSLGRGRPESLPVWPFTFAMELASEAALALEGAGLVVIGLDQARSLRFLALDGDSLELEVHATRTARGVEVRVLEGASLAFHATVRLAPAYPEAPPPLTLPPGPELLSQITVENYNRSLFHGERMLSLHREGPATAHGLEATVRVPPTDRVAAGQCHPHLEVPAGLLDGAGHVAAYWLIHQGMRRFWLFPFELESYQQFGPAPGPGELLACRCRVTRPVLEGGSGRADLDYLEATGRLWLRMTGFCYLWERYPPNFYDWLLFPQRMPRLSVPWPALEGAVARRVELPRDFLERMGGVFGRTLARAVLTPAERAWRAQGGGYDLCAWLAAKEAVGFWAQERGLTPPPPWEVEILPDSEGRPRVRAAGLPLELRAGLAGEGLAAVSAEDCGPALAAIANGGAQRVRAPGQAEARRAPGGDAAWNLNRPEFGP